MRSLSSLDWTDLVCWIVCTVLIWMSLNFRLYMIFHHPPKKLREKAREVWKKSFARSRREAQITAFKTNGR